MTLTLTPTMTLTLTLTMTLTLTCNELRNCKTSWLLSVRKRNMIPNASSPRMAQWIRGKFESTAATRFERWPFSDMIRFSADDTEPWREAAA